MAETESSKEDQVYLSVEHIKILRDFLKRMESVWPQDGVMQPQLRIKRTPDGHFELEARFGELSVRNHTVVR